MQTQYLRALMMQNENMRTICVQRLRLTHRPRIAARCLRNMQPQTPLFMSVISCLEADTSDSRAVSPRWGKEGRHK